VLIFLADDSQLRDLTFWSMGSLAGATWGKLLAILPLIGAALLLSRRLGSGLNAVALGEAQALHLGIEVQRLNA
jgi:iron complex transport system permease protein